MRLCARDGRAGRRSESRRGPWQGMCVSARVCMRVCVSWRRVTASGVGSGRVERVRVRRVRWPWQVSERVRRERGLGLP